MKDLLNPDQLRSVTITLRTFEEDLLYAQAWLYDAEENGILYQRKLTISPESRSIAQERINAALEHIALLAREFGLESEVENSANLIRSKMSVNWANLLDTQSVKLKRFGEVDPKLVSALDPAVRQLSQLALELAAVFDEQSAA
jgi:hypothetical protein